MRKKLRGLHQAAQTSIGIRPGACSVAMEVSLLVNRVRLIEQQVGETVRVLRDLVDRTEEGGYLLFIPGINYLSVAALLAELGSLRSYRNAKQLIKMAGTSPIESESGGKRASHTSMSKEGRPRLRYCAWTAVMPLLRHSTDFRAWTLTIFLGSYVPTRHDANGLDARQPEAGHRPMAFSKRPKPWDHHELGLSKVVSGPGVLQINGHSAEVKASTSVVLPATRAGYSVWLPDLVMTATPNPRCQSTERRMMDTERHFIVQDQETRACGRLPRA